MQRHFPRVTYPPLGTSVLFHSSIVVVGFSLSTKFVNAVRHYTHEPSPFNTLNEHPPSHKQQSFPKLSQSLRKQSGRPLNRRVDVAEAIEGEEPYNDPNVRACLPTEMQNLIKSPSYSHQAHDKETQRQPTSSRILPPKLPKPSHRSKTTTPVSSASLLKSLEAQHSPFASTLRKALTPRHTGPHGAVADGHSAHQTDEQRREAAELRADEDRDVRKNGYDPALVVRSDSRLRQVRLNPVQQGLIWTARQQQYHGLLQRIVVCLQSHRSPVEKCQTLFALHDEVIRQHLRLRPDTYEDIFHTLYSVGVRRGGGAGQPGKASLSASVQPVTGDAQWERDLSGHEAASVNGGSLPTELTSAAAASSTVLSAHGMEHVWEMYRYAVDSGTDPTARILQYVMGLLEHASVALAVSRAALAPADLCSDGSNSSSRRRARSRGLLLMEAKAHSLMMDADRFHLTPSEYTINSYIGICEACDVMHLAMARFTDYQTRHERQPSAGMYARLITGLVRCGRYEDAVAVVTTVQNVPMTNYLLNAVLQAARHSRDPASAFTFYRSLFFSPVSPLRLGEDKERGAQRRTEQSTRSSIRLVPSLVTFSILVEVMQLTQSCMELDFVLAEMQHYRIKGNGMLLNKLLKLMEKSGTSQKKMEALRSAMESKQVLVFDENRGRRNLPVAS